MRMLLILLFSFIESVFVFISLYAIEYAGEFLFPDHPAFIDTVIYHKKILMVVIFTVLSMRLVYSNFNIYISEQVSLKEHIINIYQKTIDKSKINPENYNGVSDE
jgi:hypothetical protein